MNNLEQKNAENICQVFACICGKKYKARNSLWYHKQKCRSVHFENEHQNCDSEVKMLTNVVLAVVKQNQEFVKENGDLKHLIIDAQKQMMKVIENGTHNTTNNTNSHNKAFNLNFFLNETCKDAMNIMDFVDSIQLQLSDLEKVGEIGYVEGISNIIVKNLKQLDITQRPVHCTDKKRETMYIKDENKWEKDESNNKIKKAIKQVAFKNQRLLSKFKEEHSDCVTYNSKYSDQYNKIIVESMGGSGNNNDEKERKIIKNILKNVVIKKDIG